MKQLVVHWNGETREDDRPKVIELTDCILVHGFYLRTSIGLRHYGSLYKLEKHEEMIRFYMDLVILKSKHEDELKQMYNKLSDYRINKLDFIKENT